MLYSIFRNTGERNTRKPSPMSASGTRMATNQERTVVIFMALIVSENGRWMVLWWSSRKKPISKPINNKNTVCNVWIGAIYTILRYATVSLFWEVFNKNCLLF